MPLLRRGGMGDFGAGWRPGRGHAERGTARRPLLGVGGAVQTRRSPPDGGAVLRAGTCQQRCLT